MTAGTRTRRRTAPGTAPDDWRMTLVRRTGRPPLRFLGRPVLDLNWGRVGAGEVACRVWAVRSGGYVLAYPDWNGIDAWMCAQRVRDAARLALAFEAAAREAGTVAPQEDGTAHADAIAALRRAALHAAWAGAFRDLVGAALDALDLQADMEGETP